MFDGEDAVATQRWRTWGGAVSAAPPERKQMTPAQVLLTAAIAVAVGFWGDFDLGYTLGHDAGKRGAK